MDLIFYAASENGNTKKVESLVKATPPIEKLIVCRTIQDLHAKLKRPTCDVLAVVLLIADEKDFREILTDRDLLVDFRIILILPVRQMSSIAGVHDLRPRFVTCVDGDMSEVAAVLDKIRSKLREFEVLTKGGVTSR